MREDSHRAKEVATFADKLETRHKELACIEIFAQFAKGKGIPT